MPAARPEALATYRAKRDFTRTAEPAGIEAAATGHSFVVQKHAATRLHYDFRLELDGVLKSWAVTRGPSYDPADKRLAVRTEDHPLDYGSFEGTIPAGEYGGGTVMLWDQGTWRPLHDPQEGLESGHLHFLLDGTRLKGEWSLVRLRHDRTGGKRENWLLVKGKDGFAGAEGAELLADQQRSVTTGRSMEEIAAGKAAKPAKSAKVKPVRPAKSKRKLPAFVEPQLATLVEAPPEGPEWLFEIKYDGYRAQLGIGGGEARIHTRSGLDWSDRFPELVTAALTLGIDGALLDGEIVVVGKDGMTDFGGLQAALSEATGGLSYMAFDLLALDGRDLRQRPLSERKTLLAQALGKYGRKGPIFYGDHLEGDGAAFLAEIAKRGLEGIVAKRADAPYHSGRGSDWLKVKSAYRQEFVIGGWVPSPERSRAFSSLALGVTAADGSLAYVGRVGTGFDAEGLGSLAQRMAPLAATKSPFAEVPRDAARGVKWLRPELVAEVRFAGWSRDGRLRHASFLGLREDKRAKEVREAMPKPAAEAAATGQVRLTHPERVLFPEAEVTKQDLADYYGKVADRMLPFIGGHLVSLLRCPDGAEEKCFMQRHPGAGLGDAIRHVPVPGKDGKSEDYLAIDDLDGILAAVQAGSLELHVWGVRADDIERPDRLVIDLDPDEGLDFADVRKAALELRMLLQELELESFPLLTGGKGVHVIAPLEPKWEWPIVEAFAKGVAERMARQAPDRFTSNMRKAVRGGKIFVDWLRNQRSSTAICPWSTRAKPLAPIAVPVGWDELRRAKRADPVTIKTAARRLKLADPWPDYATLRQSFTREAAAKLDAG